MEVQLLRQSKIMPKKRELRLFKNYGAIPAKMLLGKHIAVLGTTGSGKSVTCASLAEEMIETGFLVVMLDSEGDYEGLSDWDRERVVMFGRKHSRDSKGIQPGQISKAVSRVLDDKLSIVITMRDYTKSERIKIMVKFMRELYDRVTFERLRVAVAVFIDELHQYAPQNKSECPELTELIGEYAKQGRKRGLTLVGASQRPSDVNKNFLTQCRVRFLHRVVAPQDFGAYSEIMHLEGGMAENRRAVEFAVKFLSEGECWYLYPSNDPMDSGTRKVAVRMRKSKHTSSTPGEEVLL